MTDPRTYAGYRAHTRARSTGALIVLVDGIAGGYDTDAGRWQTICEDHGHISSHETQATARAFLHHPEEWCEPCAEEDPDA